MAAIFSRNGGVFWTLPDWPLLHQLDHQVLLVLMVVLPILTYPFLPSASRSGIRCEMFLIWPSLLSLALKRTTIWIRHGSDRPALVMQDWQVTLFLLSALAGIQGLCVPRNREATYRDFTYTAGIVELSVLHNLLRPIEAAFRSSVAELGYLLYICRLLGTAVGLLTIGVAICGCLEYYAPSALLHFTTRHVSGWYWLPENGASDDFGPTWSLVLAIVVGLAPVVLSLVIFYAWHRNVLK